MHISQQPDSNEADADLIGGMLTAIRDFTQDAFGRGQEGQLDEIQYGDLRSLVEAAQDIYLAVVDGRCFVRGAQHDLESRNGCLGYAHQSERAELDLAGVARPATEQAAVFDRFFRSRSAQGINGTGLGLHIARWLVELHGGRIWLESDVERGSTFYVTFPLADVTSD